MSRRPAKRFNAPLHQITSADRRRFNALLRRFKRTSRTSGYYTLEDPTEGEMLFLISLIPSYQRDFKTSQYKTLLRELDRGAWVAENGDSFRILINSKGDPELYDGQTRAAAFWTYSALQGGEIPGPIQLFFTYDVDAYRSVDANQVRTFSDVAHMNNRPPVSCGVKAGILYEKFNFGKVPRMTGNESDAQTYEDMDIVRFCRSLPQSSGDQNRLALAGVYAAAIRARRIDEEKAKAFFTALINKEHALPGTNTTVEHLKMAVKQIGHYSTQRRGQPGKVLSAYISMQAFRAWYEDRPLPKRDTEPPGGKKALWPGVMPEIPLSQDYLAGYSAAAE